jgi:MoaA/NifB/PqqE/SkfB family radical SAM enzyme
LTYQVSPGYEAEDAPLERVKRELSTEEWKTILDKAWQAGIPQAVFTGGEPTLRPDLLELITYTESVGMVSGLLTDGLRLAKPKYLHDLLGSGLDYVMVLLNPEDELSMQALGALMAEDISVTVHLTLTAENERTLPDLLDRLQVMGVKRLSLTTDHTKLRETLLALRRLAAEKGLELIWDLPVPYSRYHPVALEAAEGELAQGAGKAWLYVEPDGDVLPAQGINQVLGNFLTDDWAAIWARRPQ